MRPRLKAPTLKVTAVALMACAALAIPVSAASAGSDDLDVVGLASSGTKLVEFESDNTRIRGGDTVTGLAGDTFLVGIDYRVQDGKLYGVGNTGGVYSIDGKGAATKVVQLSQTLAGTNFGVDFNPAANALRVVSDTGQNLRQPFPVAPSTTFVATATDTTLTNPAVAPNPAATALGVAGAAYTNNDLDTTTATTLFDADTAADRISVQSPANAGLLVPTGNLGVAAGPNAGFDIYSTLRKGKTVGNKAFATLEVEGRNSFYAIDLLTGTADRIGGLNGVTDIAIPLDQR